MDPKAGIAPIEPGWRGQIGLTGLILWVLAAGVAAALMRGSELRLGGPGTEIEANRVLGAILATLALGLAFGLVLTIARRLRDGRVIASEGRSRFLWAAIWRGFAAAALLVAVSEERMLLGREPPGRSRVARSYDWFYNLHVEPTRLALYPIGLALLMIGTIVALGAAPSRPVTRRSGRGIFVVLAAAVGLLLVMNPGFQYYPYAVLTVLEGVVAARQHPDRAVLARPRLFDRLDHAGLAAAAGALVLLAVALWLARDFRKGAIPAPLSPLWFLARLLAVAVSVGIGLELIYVKVPTLDPFFAEGFGLLLGKPEVSAIILGFGALSVGLAARALAPPPIGATSIGWKARVWMILSRSVLLILLFLMAIHSGAAWAGGSALGNAPNDLAAGKPWIVVVDAWLSNRAPLIEALSSPERVIWTLVLVWIASRLIVLAVLRGPDRLAPLDAVADAPATFARFLWLSIGLTAVCLAAMPTFLLLGVSLFHLRQHGGDLFGWPF